MCGQPWVMHWHDWFAIRIDSDGEVLNEQLRDPTYRVDPALEELGPFHHAAKISRVSLSGRNRHGDLGNHHSAAKDVSRQRILIAGRSCP